VTLADWLEPLPDAELMRATDAWAIGECGVPSLDLMERAGEGLAGLVRDLFPGGRVVVLAGRGNNGGDGLVAGRLLRAGGREVDLLLADGELSADAAANLARLGVGTLPLATPIPADAAVLIDALLGTGASGEPRGDVADAIRAACDSGIPVISADIPSGVDASSGTVAATAIRALATATFHAAKPGLCIEPGRSHAGTVRVIEIGIPDGAPGEASVGLIRDDVLDTLPRRGVASTKFTSGPVLVAGGSPGLTGAPCLAAMGAQRAGAGYVTACVPASLSMVFESRLLEVMTLALPDDGGSLTPACAAPLLAAARHGGALVVGPGLGRRDEALAFVRELVASASLPLVIDADGLSAYAGELAALRGAGAVLTPHEGELARLLGISSEEVAAERLRCVREAAEAAGAVVVLKGDDTLVAAGGLVAVSPGASAGLATAGTGDVLAGVVGALLAAQVEPLRAAVAAVRLHALAGIAAAARRGRDGMIASDVIEELAVVRTR